ncbi:hypothetical protein L227DRAFT_577281 [Lentinus tigrinus ALCF2SS1-6]|uniref:Secreted protein n=1 Tax=Lentinus tigrinus ALCF2SS1-6 TaxID=1328759 RepID=A0A5C2S5F4_9APHY|nr:hypothetical protein L227DRAFT_577281 [Lentinus tigrinus ALCF2SS1-6]
MLVMRSCALAFSNVLLAFLFCNVHGAHLGESRSLQAIAHLLILMMDASVAGGVIKRSCDTDRPRGGMLGVFGEPR